jgi:hypothetical protein
MVLGLFACPNRTLYLFSKFVDCFEHVCSTLTSVERVEGIKYLGTMLTDQNSIQEEIKSRLKLGNACYHSVQDLLSSRMLSKNLKLKIYKNLILPVVLYGC